MNTYKVFKRAWWKRESNGRLVPYPHARKTVLRRGLTLEEARMFCKTWNDENPPGPTSIKAEFTSEEN